MNNRRAHRIASGLLLLMVGLFAIGKTLEPSSSAWGYLRAFAEAGMIGALADWFAVVALFRHPLGLAWIPHTAIIARRKDQIADSLARFVEEHFLGPVQIAERLSRITIAENAAEWLQKPDNAEKITRQIADALPGVIEALDDSDMRRFLRENLLAIGSRTPLAPLAGRLLEMLVEKGRHQELLQQALLFGKNLLDSHRPTVEEHIELELRKVPRFLGLRRLLVKRMARRIITNMQSTLDAVLADSAHPLRDHFHAHALQLIDNLAHSGEWQSRLEHLKHEMLSNTALNQSLDTLWSGIKQALIADFTRQESIVITKFASSLREIGAGLQLDAGFRTKLDHWLRDAVQNLILTHSHEIGHLIRDTARRWDGAEMAAKLENQVGADLQYIRINGTLVGGLVGLVLHALGQLIWK